jgi:hypothetical protein
MESKGSSPHSQAPATCPYPKPAQSRPHTFHVPTRMSLFRFLQRDISSRDATPRRSEWGSSLPPDCFVSRGSISHLFVRVFFLLRRSVVSTSPSHQAGGTPLVGCPRLLIQFIRNYPPYRRHFLHPQPEDAPCRGDRDPLEAVPPSATWGRAIPWWQGPTCHGTGF